MSCKMFDKSTDADSRLGLLLSTLVTAPVGYLGTKVNWLKFYFNLISCYSFVFSSFKLGTDWKFLAFCKLL